MTKQTTPLRQRMIDDMTIRNMSQNQIRQESDNSELPLLARTGPAGRAD